MSKSNINSSTSILTRLCQILIVVLLLLALTESLWPFQMATQVESLEEISLDDIEITPNSLSQIEQESAYLILATSPLFTVDRKPYSLPEATRRESPIIAQPQMAITEQSSPQQATFILEGIIRSPSIQIALVHSASSGDIARLKMNEQFEGWELSGIDSNIVTLTKGSQEQTLTLVKNDND